MEYDYVCWRSFSVELLFERRLSTNSKNSIELHVFIRGSHILGVPIRTWHNSQRVGESIMGTLRAKSSKSHLSLTLYRSGRQIYCHITASHNCPSIHAPSYFFAKFVSSARSFLFFY